MKKFIWPIIGIVFVAFVVWLVITPGKVKVSVYDGFAQCIKASGTTFYGAFWCPHCQAQKKMFGTASQYLPYVECSAPNGKDQLAVCTTAGVSSYPTWVFPDGSRLSGEVALNTIAEKTSCVLPADGNNSATPINLASSSPAL
jgi:hypothetical protein